MKKNNWWNRLFHPKEVKACHAKKEQLEKLISKAPILLEDVGHVVYTTPDDVVVTGATSLLEVLELHRTAWSLGYQNTNLAPDSCGMFRCTNIEDMSPREVFLGNIFGLFTQPIPFWEKHKNDGLMPGGFIIYQYLTVYQIVLQQYKEHLRSNIEAIARTALKERNELIELGY
jgi:hypothetical protein